MEGSVWRARISAHEEIGLAENPEVRHHPTLILNMEVLEMHANSRQRYSSIALCQPVPAADALEARWAANAIANLARDVSPDSVVGVVLSRARQELLSLSLTEEATDGESEVLGPIRLRIAG